MFTVGGTMSVEHAETVTDVPLGTSEGVAGQTFRLGRPPVLLDGGPPVVEVSSAEGWQRWDVVERFGRSGPDDRHVRVDATTGEFTFPPVLREPDGTLRQCGAVPPKGAQVRVARYRTGGGPAGNVARGAISVLRSSVPYVARVVNREAARGGVAGETVDPPPQRRPPPPRRCGPGWRAVTAGRRGSRVPRPPRAHPEPTTRSPAPAPPGRGRGAPHPGPARTTPAPSAPPALPHTARPPATARPPTPEQPFPRGHGHRRPPPPTRRRRNPCCPYSPRGRWPRVPSYDRWRCRTKGRACPAPPAVRSTRRTAGSAGAARPC
ncbi:hypothetical protein SGLAM104S_01371 [Streptomyces glaucescens]